MQRLPQSGQLDRATLVKLCLGLFKGEPDFLSPAAARYTTMIPSRSGGAILLNRPTSATDSAWSIRNPDGSINAWNAEEERLFQEFVPAYLRMRLDLADRDHRERLDCADAALEALIAFARARRLPILLRGGGTLITHRGPAPVAASARGSLAAANIPLNTIPVPPDQAQPMDIGILRYAQSTAAGNSAHHHTYNIIVLDRQKPGRSLLLYGSLKDEFSRHGLAKFNGRWNLAIDTDQVSELMVDRISPTTQADRDARWSEAQCRTEVHTFLSPFMAGRSADDIARAVDDFIVTLRANTAPNQPTPIYRSAGEDAVRRISTRDLIADKPLLTGLVTDLNARYGLTGERAMTSVYLPVPEQPPPSEATKAQQARSVYRILDGADPAAARTAAVELLRRLGVPADRIESEATSFTNAVEATRQLRRWDFAAFNRAEP